MKKHLLGMLMAGAAVLSACEANLHPELTGNEPDVVVFTASLGQGTKTYLDYDAEAGVYKTKWADGDGILLLALQADQTYSSTNLSLTSGAGTTEGVFKSAISGNEYIAYYGRYESNSAVTSGVINPAFPSYQYDRKLSLADGTASFQDDAFPMYAEGESNHLEFKNLGAVLKMSLLGTDYIDNIVVKANVPISGYATIVRGSDDAPLHTVMIDSLSMNSITYYLKAQLSETEAKDCYIVLPAQTYTGGLKVTINSTLGSMTKTFSSDLVFQRSQLRAIPTLTYVNESYHSMGLISSASNWTEDCELVFKDNVYVGRVTLSEDEEFKFRANGSWDYNLGSYDAVVSGTVVNLVPDGPDMKVAVAGTYDVVLNLAEKTAVFTLVEEEIPVVSTYDELATFEDGSVVRAQGYVLAANSRGFIFNLNGTIDNSVFVYQGADQSMYAPKIGNIVELVAEKGKYGEHAELTNIKSVEIIDDSVQDWTATHLVDLSKNPTAFDEFAYDRPVFVRMRGTLEKNGEEWNVVVNGANRKGSIEFPAWDLSGYIGQPIIVDGWYIGGTTSTLSVVERYISYGGVDGGGTEDVVPGDDIY